MIIYQRLKTRVINYVLKDGRGLLVTVTKVRTVETVRNQKLRYMQIGEEINND